MSRIVVISDFCNGLPSQPSRWTLTDFARAWEGGTPAIGRFPPPPVKGGYLERLPLACVASGMVETAEIWSFCGSDEAGFDSRPALEGNTHPPPASEALVRRVFRANAHPAPYGSWDMAAHIRVYGAPKILCVWGLGITKDLLDLCRDSILIYNSIDAPAIRIPPELSACFDIFLTGAEWQSEEIRRQHPDALCAVLPVGPEFASDETFFPTGARKEYDAVYVAATQPYKRHSLLLDALETLGPLGRALCVVGYGHMTEELAQTARARGLNIDWTGPVSHGEVNALINRARVGLVCGRDDGAPAILTEYMLAGLPVLANDRLVCGLQYIRPDTGIAAPEACFGDALARLLREGWNISPRRVVQAQWTWKHSILRLSHLIDEARARRTMKVWR